MNLQETLATVVKRDPALEGFRPDDLPDAAKARIQNTLCSLERHLDSEELEILRKWTGGDDIFKTAVAQMSEGECCYYVFPDDSLYFHSSGDSEVWSDAADFARERISFGYKGPLDSMDASLLNFLGGPFTGEAEERGVRG